MKYVLLITLYINDHTLRCHKSSSVDIDIYLYIIYILFIYYLCYLYIIYMLFMYYLYIIYIHIIYNIIYYIYNIYIYIYNTGRWNRGLRLKNYTIGNLYIFEDYMALAIYFH